MLDVCRKLRIIFNVVNFMKVNEKQILGEICHSNLILDSIVKK